MPNQPTPADALAELASMKRIVTVLDRLDEPARGRVLRWLAAAYGPSPTPAADREDVTR
jgi:hypothetical protein